MSDGLMSPLDPSALFAVTPFAALTLIAAPAVLTNACSVLALGTSNRFARSIDRCRSLAATIGAPEAADDPLLNLRIRQFERAHRRTLLLLAALRSFYAALGLLAAAALLSLLGAGIQAPAHPYLAGVALALALGAGSAGVVLLAYGCTVLVRETRLAVVSLSEEAQIIRARFPVFATDKPQ